MTDEKTQSYDEVLMSLPAKVREDAAKTRNSYIRAKALEGELDKQRREFRMYVRRLRHRHDVNVSAIARLLGLNRTRIAQLLDEKKGR